MTQSLAERITSAKSTDRVRNADLETLIADAKAEHERLVSSAEHHDRESIDFALSDDDREEASRLAGHYQRTARGLLNEIEALETKLAEKLNSDARKAEEAEAAARKARHDALVSRFRDRVPALIDELIVIFAEVRASESGDAVEADARAVPRIFHHTAGPIGQFLKMKIPAWDRSGHQWPPAAPNPMDAAAEHTARQIARMREDQERENARWSRYMVEAPTDGTRTAIETRRGIMPIGGGYRNGPVEAVMTVEGVEEAKANGCTVTLLKQNESVGLPTSAAVLA
jgi:hypothetical protein